MADSFIEHVSLCRVSKTDEGKIWLIRRADIEDGIISLFRPAKGNKVFDNRERLFWNDGPDTNGAFGIWRWSAVPNENDYTKDYVESNYAEDLQAVEIISIPSVITTEKLQEMMTADGLDIVPVSKCFLLCPQSTAPIKYRGFLCSITDFSTDGGKFVLKESVTFLPLHSIFSNDTITIDGKVFYKSLGCGDPVCTLPMKDPLEIVRGKILNRISWGKVKSSGVTKSTWQTIRDFITDVPAHSVYQEIQSACLCSEEEARNYVDSFLSQAEKYLSDEDSEGIISAILENCPELSAKTEATISEVWHEAHQGKIEAVTRELEAKKSELLTAERRLEELQKLIQSHEQLVEEVSVRVQQRISEARKDAAGFIAEMAFMSPGRESPTHSPAFYSPGKNCDSDGMEHIDSWKEALDVLSVELNEAGIALKYARNFAAFLYSAYVNRVPILLAGPNGEDIAEAFSVSLCGKTAGSADCSVSYFPGFGSGITGSNDEVFMVRHVFRSEWMMHIPDFTKLGGYCFIVHPFAEDLAIEPKSLFSCVMPVFTELIVDSAPKGKYIGAKRSGRYREYQPQKPGAVHDSWLASFGFSPYARRRTQAVLDDFHALLGSGDKDSDCLLAVFPYAFIAGRNRESLLDRLSVSMKISSGLRKELAAFMGEYDE